MKRRNFFSWLAGAAAGLFGAPVAAFASPSADSIAPGVRFKVSSSFDGKMIWLDPVLSHVIDEGTRRKLAKPVGQMIDAVWAELEKKPADRQFATDPEAIALNQVAITLGELHRALTRKYPW